MLKATTQTTENIQTRKGATGMAFSPVHKLHLAASQHLHQYHPTSEISSLTHLPCTYPYGSALEIGSSAALPNDHHHSPALEFGSSASSPYAHQYNPTVDYSPLSSIVQAQRFNSLLDHGLPEGSRNPHQCNPSAEVDVPAASRNFQHRVTSLNPSLFERSKPNLQYNTIVTSPNFQKDAEFSLVHSALPEGFQNSSQYNVAAAESLATYYRQARVLAQPFDAVSSACFRIQGQTYSPQGSFRDGSLKSLTPAPMPDYGTKGEPTRGTIESDCCVDAAEQNVWHTRMNRHGIHRPNGEIRYTEDGTMQWREKAGSRWCKFFQSRSQNSITHSV